VTDLDIRWRVDPPVVLGPEVKRPVVRPDLPPPAASRGSPRPAPGKFPPNRPMVSPDTLEMICERQEEEDEAFIDDGRLEIERYCEPMEERALDLPPRLPFSAPE
jgi:hypothetical protein